MTENQAERNGIGMDADEHRKEAEELFEKIGGAAFSGNEDAKAIVGTLIGIGHALLAQVEMTQRVHHELKSITIQLKPQPKRG